MVMPLAGRAVAAVIGGLLVLATVSSVTGTLIVSRSVSSRLTRWVDRIIDGAYQLAAWLIVAYVGFALLLWPFAARGHRHPR
jgi:hypothetical protein